MGSPLTRPEILSSKYLCPVGQGQGQHRDFGQGSREVRSRDALGIGVLALTGTARAMLSAGRWQHLSAVENRRVRGLKVGMNVADAELGRGKGLPGVQSVPCPKQAEHRPST